MKHQLLHTAGEHGRGLITKDGQVHTWPEEWCRHPRYAAANEISVGWTPLHIRPDGSVWSPGFGEAGLLDDLVKPEAHDARVLMAFDTYLAEYHGIY